ncbi:phosphatase PAP2 family protein [Aquabacterium sp. J223]|uniref:phosphatase PAP2 family protein n=1 Tax=Aquabacterium sp. J223 TaxID=2898431 RepID=UPI0021AE1E61|nr:phosphatase PAP2 family protein [Aquabacterium sp. J223]UUX96204.1 phosphatase PAP2 family protein [Aquabacterium sp. J223]
MTPITPTHDVPSSASRLPRAWKRWLLLALLVAGLLRLGVGLGSDGLQALDERLMLALRSPHAEADLRGPWWLPGMVRDVSALGSTVVLTLVTVGALGQLLLMGRRAAALRVLLAVLGGLVISHGLKGLIERPRPRLVPHLDAVVNASFPSGHALMSAVVYLTLGVLLAAQATRRRERAYVLGLALLMTVAVGSSRVYLGVHWPSDVLGGWALGLAWALLCARWLPVRTAGDAP